MPPERLSRVDRGRARPVPVVAPVRSRRRPERVHPGSFNSALPDVLEEGSLKKIVDRQDNIPVEKRIGSDYTHVSSLIDMCPRQFKLMFDRNMPQLEKVHGGDRVVWEMGRAAERHFRTQYISGVDYKGVHGKWQCLCQRTEVVGFAQLDAPECPTCRTRPLHYAELPYYDHAAGVVGNPDLPIFTQGAFLITEIKSMNAKDFEALEEPQPDHIFQGGSYRRLYELNDLPVHPLIRVVYVRKDYRYGSPYKEYNVDALSRTVTTMLDIGWDTARELHAVRRTAEIPERVCTHARCTRAKNCPVLVPCWS